MNRMLPNASFRSCPSCGAALNSGAITCNSCGGLAVVESIVGRLKSELKHQSGEMSLHLKDRTVLLWALALCPIVILAPMLAIFLSFRKPKETVDRPAAKWRPPDVLILIVAICNIVLSVIFWRWIGDAVLSTAISIGLFLKTNGATHPKGTGAI